MIKLNLPYKRNLMKALVSAFLISIYPFVSYGADLKMFAVNFIVIFPGVFIGCTFIDLILKYKELREK